MSSIITPTGDTAEPPTSPAVAPFESVAPAVSVAVSLPSVSTSALVITRAVPLHLVVEPICAIAKTSVIELVKSPPVAKSVRDTPDIVAVTVAPADKCLPNNVYIISSPFSPTLLLLADIPVYVGTGS